jgi:hypothetical protein
MPVSVSTEPMPTLLPAETVIGAPNHCGAVGVDAGELAVSFTKTAFWVIADEMPR